MSTAGLSIGALSKRSRVKAETIRYYERIGIMPEPRRSTAGYRIYGPDHLRRLSFVRRGRELGFGLDDLRTLLRLIDGHSYTCAEVYELAVAHIAEIRRKIADLRRLQRAMEEMATQCSGDRIPECPIIETLFDVKPLVRKLRQEQKL